METPTPSSPEIWSNNGSGSPKKEFEHLSRLSKEDIVQRVLELERELNEFQESSKELEIALEEELKELELANADLKKAVQVKEHEVVNYKHKILALNNNITDIHEESNRKIQQYDAQIAILKQQLVSVEIANDSMESNDRMLSHKLEMANQFNNELLEKIAIVESDFEAKKKEAIEKQLYISNYQNQVKELSSKVASLETKLKFYENNEMDSSFLSMKDILKAGPPVTNSTQSIPKSNSLKKLHDLTTKSENMSRKVQNLKGTFYKSTPSGKHMKATATTQVSNNSHMVVTNIERKPSSKRTISGGSRSSNKENNDPASKALSSSPSIIDLSLKLRPKSSGRSSRSSSLLQETDFSTNTSMPLETITGSPNPIHVKDIGDTIRSRSIKKKGKRSGLLDSLKSMGSSS